MNYIEFKRDTSHNWLVHDPVLAPGEPGLETDTQRLKCGDGHTRWSKLPYIALDGTAFIAAPQVYVQAGAPIDTPRGSVWIVSAADAVQFPPAPPWPGTGRAASTGSGQLTVTEA